MAQVDNRWCPSPVFRREVPSAAAVRNMGRHPLLGIKTARGVGTDPERWDQLLSRAKFCDVQRKFGTKPRIVEGDMDRRRWKV